jgi:hypothetical protein
MNSLKITPTRPLPKTKSIRIVGTLCEVWPLRKSIMPIYELGVSRSWAHQHTAVRRPLVGSRRFVRKSSGGADLALRRLEIDEARDIARYGKQLRALGDKPTRLEGSVDVKPKCYCLFE